MQILIEYRSRLVLDLVQYQREITGVGKQPVLQQIGALRLAQCAVTTKCPLAERLYPLEPPPKPIEFGIEVWILALGKNGLIK